MNSFGKLLGIVVTALILGFGSGRMLAPQPLGASGGGCPHEICYVGVGGGYFCQATVVESYCKWTNGDEVCLTQDCGELCDPDDPECFPPKD